MTVSTSDNLELSNNVGNRTKINTKTTGNGRLGLLILGVGIISTLSLVTNIFLGILSLGNNASQNMIQLSSGETITAKAVSTNERSPIVIKSFVKRIYTGLYTMDGYLPRSSLADVKNPIPDPGIPINGNEQKVTSAAWEASFGMDLKLRKEILKELGKITPNSVFKQQKSVVFVAHHIGEPIPIPDKPGNWTVNLISTLVAFQAGEPIGEVIPNNKKIYIRAVIPPQYKEFTNPVAEIIANIRSSGLEIYQATDLTKEELEQASF